MHTLCEVMSFMSLAIKHEAIVKRVIVNPFEGLFCYDLVHANEKDDCGQGER